MVADLSKVGLSLSWSSGQEQNPLRPFRPHLRGFRRPVSKHLDILPVGSGISEIILNGGRLSQWRGERRRTQRSRKRRRAQRLGER